MKKISIIVAIISIFMLQLGVVSAKEEQANLDGTYNNLETVTYSCGKSAKGAMMIKNMPSALLRTVQISYKVIQVIVPVILVILGGIDFLKAITSGKEDEIKKAQMTFVKRLIYGALVFFMLAIVKLVVSVAADSGSRTNRIISCTDCLLNNQNCIKD